MGNQDTVRLGRMQENMKASNLDALVCRLPENVVYLTDYWPHHGFSIAVLPQSGKPLLFVPEVEEEYTDPEWAEVELFGWGLLKDGDLYENYHRLLQQAHERLGLKGARVGVEQNFEVVAPTYRSAEPVVPSGPWSHLLDQVFADAILIDVTDLLQNTRAIKSEYELGKLRIANEIAEMGLNLAVKTLAPGMTEAQVGSIVEQKIRAEGPGYKGARLARSLCEVGTGPVGSTKGTLLVPSSTRVVNEGDFVMIECATVVDGYWSDLTYMAVAGRPNDRQRQVHNAVLEAQQAAAKMLCAGNSYTDPDTAARKVFEKAGLAQYYPHITGHGVGLRYHEFIPFLAPGSVGTLQEGMVSSVEPGVYIEDFGGVRIEDDVAVGSSGPVFLSTPRQPW